MGDPQVFSESMVWSTYVYGWYQGFIPMYAFSILRAYPTHFVRLFVREPLEPDVSRALDIVREYSDRVEVLSSVIPNLPGECRGYRWLLRRTHYRPFAYAFNGDVDFVIIRETPTLLEWHLRQAQLLSKPYSNVVRQMGGRLAGCHFMIVEPYFDHVDPVLDDLLREQSVEVLSRHDNDAADEQLLYETVKRALGVLEPHEPRPAKSQRNGGFHVGTVRGGILPTRRQVQPEWTAKVLDPLNHPLGRLILDTVEGRAGQLLCRTREIFQAAAEGRPCACRP